MIRRYLRSDVGQASIACNLAWWAQSLMYHHTDVPDQYLGFVTVMGTPLTLTRYWLAVRFHAPW